MSDFDEMSDPDQPEPLPQDLPEDKVREMIEHLENESRKIGLYMRGAGIHVDKEAPEGFKEHKLVMHYGIGDVAFSPRVQDPEQDKVNDAFRQIAAGDVEDQVEEIRKRYAQKEQNEEDGT